MIERMKKLPFNLSVGSLKTGEVGGRREKGKSLLPNRFSLSSVVKYDNNCRHFLKDGQIKKRSLYVGAFL